MVISNENRVPEAQVSVDELESSLALSEELIRETITSSLVPTKNIIISLAKRS